MLISTTLCNPARLDPLLRKNQVTAPAVSTVNSRMITRCFVAMRNLNFGTLRWLGFV